MTKVKYKFDPESLQFTGQDESFKSKFVREYLGVIVAGLFIAFALLILSAYVNFSPEIREKRRHGRNANEVYQELSNKFDEMEKVLKDLEKRDENIYKAILESDPKEHAQDSISQVSKMLKILEGRQPLEIAEFVANEIDSLLFYLRQDKDKYKDFAKVLDEKAKMLVHIPSIQPVKNTNLEVMVYGYGKRIDPFYKTPVDHKGMDFSVPEGTRVFATANGKVSFVGMKRGDGNTVVINHGYGFETKYTHLDKILVTRGKQVERGDYIGTAGNTGKSMSPHLHYEVHINGKAVNPVNFYFADLKPGDYEKMIKFSSRGGVSLD